MTTTMGEPTSLEMGYYGRVLRRYAWLILLCAIVGLVLGYGYLQTKNREVKATTSVNVNVISTDPFNAQHAPSTLIDADTETQTVTSADVLQAAASQLHQPSSHVRGHTTATLVPGTTIMKITYSDNSTKGAEAGADAVANAYLDFRSTQAADRAKNIVAQLTKRRNSLRDDLVRINSIIRNANPSSGRAVQAESDRQSINIELGSLSTEINTFEGLDTTGGTVLSSAAQNPTTVSPSKKLILATGLILGLLVGVVLAFLLNALDRRVRTARDLSRAGGGMVLGELTSNRAQVPAEGPDMEAVRTVRELLLATLPDEPAVVAIADLTPGKPTGDVAANFATAVAETGRAVELVMVDFEPEVVERVAKGLGLGVGAQAGAAGSRYSASDGISLVRRQGHVGLDDHDAADTSRFTVVALPHSSAHASLLETARRGHAVVLVVAKGATRRPEISRIADELAVVGARIHGSVFVPRSRKPQG